MEKQLLNIGVYLAVPPEIAVCPYCKAALEVHFDGFEQEEDGTWSASEVESQCASEPDIDSDDWEGWELGHSYFPYVYQLPVHDKILSWVNSNYRFDPDNEPPFRGGGS